MLIKSGEPPIFESALAELEAIARTDERLRGLLARICRSVLEWADPAPPTRTTPLTLSAPILRPARPVESPAKAIPIPVTSSTFAPTLAGPRAAGPITPVVAQAVRPELQVEDLGAVADRLALKGDACDWQVHRRDHSDEADGPLQERARAAGGCKLWMCRPDMAGLDPAPMATLSECYRNAARAVRLAAAGHDRPDGPVPLRSLLLLLAEAVSALRAGIRAVHDGTDPDQDHAFQWLRSQTERNQIYISKHMRLDDPADPEQWSDLRGRLEQAQATLNQEQKRAAGLRQVQYHVKKLAAADPAGDEAVAQARQVVEKVVRQVTAGLPPSNVDLRNLLLPVLDRLPSDAEPAFGQVLRSIREYQAAHPEPTGDAESDEEEEPAGEPTPDVLAVREALAGRAVVVVGGQAREESAETLRQALGLSRVDWLTSRPHESHYRFEAAIRRPDVAVVLLLIRFSSHSYSEVKAFCDDDKPLVRLPRGYGVNQVAAEIREQAGRKLGVAER